MSDEITTRELARLTARIEVAVDKLEETAVTHDDLSHHLRPLERDVSEVRGALKFIIVAMVGAFLTALFSLIINPATPFTGG